MDKSINIKMNILFHLARYPGWGGIETVTSNVVDELLKRDYHIDIISHTQQEDVQNIPQGVNLYKMPAAEPVSEQNIHYFNDVVSNGQYDLIIYQDSYAPCEELIVKISKTHNIPFIIFEHNTPLLLYKIRIIEKLWSIKGLIKWIADSYFRNKYLRKEVLRKRFIYENCARYVMLSKNYIPEISACLGINPLGSKFRYINNPIPSRIKSDDHTKNDEILYVGRLVPEKRVDKILKIWKHIQDRYPQYSLKIVGDGQERDKLEKLSVSLKLKRVKFHGYQKPEPFYKRGKIILMTSEFEGWGMTLVEAMSYGCIPIAEKNFSALSDIIEHNISGIMMPQKASINKWVNVLRHLMDDTSHIEEMARNARQSVKKFAIENIVDQWEELFQEVTGAREI